jgi:hypothetical protein
MAMLRTLSILLGAFAVLWLGALAAPASAEPAPCHSMSSQEAPAPSRDKPMKAMSCCVVCVTAPLPQPPVRAAFHAPASDRTPLLTALPAGRSPAPEPGPPRAVAA